MKKPWLGYALLGLAFYLLFLAAGTPSAWLAWGIDRYSGGIVRLAGTEGSLWHGTGDLLVIPRGSDPVELGRVTWRVDPWWLLLGRAQLQWQTDGGETRIASTMQISRGGIALHATDADVPAELIGRLYRPASLLAPQGQLRLHAATLTLGRGGAQGAAQVLWENAASRLSSVQPLGNYRLDVNANGPAAALRLTTLSGDLSLTGAGQWQPGTGQIALTGIAMARAHQAELEPLLRLLGTKQPGGQRSFTLNMMSVPVMSPAAPAPGISPRRRHVGPRGLINLLAPKT